MIVQNRLKELVARKERLDNRRYSYRDIAFATKLNLGTVRSWMNNDTQRFDADVIIGFCRWLDCEVGDLLIIERPVKVTNPNNDDAGNVAPYQNPETAFADLAQF